MTRPPARHRLVLLALWLLAGASSVVAPSPASATTSVSGQIDTTSPLVIDPSTSPTDAITAAIPTPATRLAFIESMPVTKVVDEVTLGNIGQAAGCSAPTKVSLLIQQHSTNDLTAAQNVGGSGYVNVPSSPGKVEFPLMTPVVFHDGYGYSFQVSTYDGCEKVVETTWAHNGATVNGGPQCTIGLPGSQPAASVYKRFGHELGKSDLPAGCINPSFNWQFDPSLPSGWIVTNGTTLFVGYHITGTPTADEQCGSNASALGIREVFWRHSPGYPDGYNDYLCMWSQYAAFNSSTPDGWYYGAPWRTDSGEQGVPRDIFVSLHTSPAGRTGSEQLGWSNPAEPNTPNCHAGKPVNCATGNYWESYSDFHIGGLGVGLDLTRTYNAQAAVSASSPGHFGYGWSSSFGDYLTIDQSSGNVTVHQDNGSTVPFSPDDSGGYAAPGWVQAALTRHADGSYTYVLPDHSRTFTFDSSGKLQSEADANSNATNLTYDASGI